MKIKIFGIFILCSIVLFSLLFLFNYFLNKSRIARNKSLINELKKDTKLYLSDIRTIVYYWGRKHGFDAFDLCDLCITTDKLIILPKSKNIIFTLAPTPLTITKENGIRYITFDQYKIPILQFNLDSFGNHVYIQFNLPDFMKSNVEIKLARLTPENKASLKFLD